MSGADCSRGEPRIIVDQPSALYDTAVSIVVEGLVPENPATLTATFHIPGSVPWRSHATFTADSDGRVDLTRQAPVAGTYGGVAPMGLFWSASPVRAETPAAPDGVMRPRIVRLEAEAAGLSSANVTLERRWAGPGVTRLLVNEGGVIGTLFLPPGAGPHPAVIAAGRCRTCVRTTPPTIQHPSTTASLLLPRRRATSPCSATSAPSSGNDSGGEDSGPSPPGLRAG